MRCFDYPPMNDLHTCMNFTQPANWYHSIHTNCHSMQQHTFWKFHRSRLKFRVLANSNHMLGFLNMYNGQITAPLGSLMRKIVNVYLRVSALHAISKTQSYQQLWILVSMIVEDDLKMQLTMTVYLYHRYQKCLQTLFLNLLLVSSIQHVCNLSKAVHSIHRTW